MKKSIIAVLAAGMLAGPALAEKPAWAGKGKPSEEQKEAHRTAMEAKESMEGDYKQAEARSEKTQKQKKEKGDDKLKGMEKQREMKSEQVQKELGKGSEKGQEARETRRKWWKFWGDDES